MNTISIKSKEINKKWFLVDADNQTLGRLSSKFGQILRGKNKVNFNPHMDMGDFVIIINANKVKISGNKEDDKMYFKHSGYPGGDKQISYKKLKSDNPELILINAVKGMLPHNRLGSKILTHLRVYADNNHPHAAQKPKKIEI